VPWHLASGLLQFFSTGVTIPCHGLMKTLPGHLTLTRFLMMDDDDSTIPHDAEIDIDD
jgi:hypothetical protein